MKKNPSRARNYATTIISKLNNFAEVLAVRVHVDVYMATAALRSITGESLCRKKHRWKQELRPLCWVSGKMVPQSSNTRNKFMLTM